MLNEFNRLITEKTPQEIFKHLIENDEDFIKFVNENKDKHIDLDKLQLNI